MPNLTIVAHIHAVEGQLDGLRAELEKLIPITRREDGCLTYDLHQDNEDPAHFMFYENWASREHWLRHMDASHLATCRKATEGMVKTSAVHEMSQVG